MAGHGAVFLGLDPESWTQLRLDPTKDPIPRRLRSDPVRWLATQQRTRALFAFTPPGEAAPEGALALHRAEEPTRGEALWPILTRDWRKPNRTHSPVMLFLYAGPPPQERADS